MVDPAGEDIDERWMLRAFDRKRSAVPALRGLRANR